MVNEFDEMPERGVDYLAKLDVGSIWCLINCCFIYRNKRFGSGMRIHHTSSVTDATEEYENRNEYSSTCIYIAKGKQTRELTTKTTSYGSV